jgi:hypothetical protein
MAQERSSRVKALFGALCLFAAVVQLGGCASTAAPTQSERAAIESAQAAIVLLRVQCTIDGRHYEPFSHSLDADNVSFGLGSFDSAGQPGPVGSRFLSERSRRDGWIYFVLRPGVYYLAVRPPQRSDWRAYERSLQTGPRWRIDVPEGAQAVYVGTLSLTGEADPLLFGDRIMRSIDGDASRVEDEHEFAAAVLAREVPVAGEPETVLMRRWREGEPIIIRTPGR